MMSDSTPQFPLGITGEATARVTPELSARHLGSGAVSVFATPEMIRLMEWAAVNAAMPFLQPGQQSVGTVVNVRHLASTPLGAGVTARAELIALDGRRLTFHVIAFDGIETIGEGQHERIIIDLARFEAKNQAKQQLLAAQPPDVPEG